MALAQDSMCDALKACEILVCTISRRHSLAHDRTLQELRKHGPASIGTVYRIAFDLACNCIHAQTLRNGGLYSVRAGNASCQAVNDANSHNSYALLFALAQASCHLLLVLSWLIVTTLRYCCPSRPMSTPCFAGAKITDRLDAMVDRAILKDLQAPEGPFALVRFASVICTGT